MNRRRRRAKYGTSCISGCLISLLKVIYHNSKLDRGEMRISFPYIPRASFNNEDMGHISQHTWKLRW